MDDIEALLIFDAQDVPAFDDALEHIERRNTAIRLLLDDLRNTRAARTSAEQDLLAHRSGLETCRADLRRAVAERAADLESANAEYAELGGVVDGLQDDLLRARETIGELRADLATATAERDAARSAARFLSDQRARDADLISALRASLIEVSRFASAPRRAPTDPTE